MGHTQTARRVSPIVPALLGAACISSSAIIVRLADVAPGTTAFYRCLLALPLLTVLALIERRRLGPRSMAHRIRAMVAGVLLGLDLVLWTYAIYDVGAGVATVLGNLQVLFVTFVAWLIFRERSHLQFLIALPIVLFGVVLVAGLLGRAAPGTDPLAGISYGLCSSIGYTGFILIIRASTKSSPHVAGPVADATIGAALAALALGWLLITAALPRLPAAVASLLLLFQPAASLLLASRVLSEEPTLLQILGAVLVCGGVLLTALSNSAPSEITGPEPTPG